MTPPAPEGDGRQVRPFGSWPSPVSPEALVAGAAAPGEVRVDGDDVWWSESRPAEGGRIELVRRRVDGTRADVLAGRGERTWNVRTGLLEYGGGAWCVESGVVVFAQWDDQRLHRVVADDPDDVPVAADPGAGHRPRGLRYGDLVALDHRWVLAVRESHPGEARRPDGRHRAGARDRRRAHRRIGGRRPVAGAGAGGRQRLRGRPPAGPARLAWIRWSHPRMPWDGTELCVAAARPRRRGRAGAARASRWSSWAGPRSRSCQPEWDRSGALWCCSDRSGWWNLHRIDDPGGPGPDAVRRRWWRRSRPRSAVPAGSPGCAGTRPSATGGCWPRSPPRDGPASRWSIPRRPACRRRPSTSTWAARPCRSSSQVVAGPGPTQAAVVVASPTVRAGAAAGRRRPRPRRAASDGGRGRRAAAGEAAGATPLRPGPRPAGRRPTGSPDPSRCRARAPAAAPPTPCCTGRTSAAWRRPRRRPPTARRDDPRRTHLRGPAHARPEPPAVDVAGLRGGRRRLRRVDRVRPPLPPAARRRVGRRRRRGLHRGRPAPRRRGRRRRRPDGHPRRVGRRLHRARRPVRIRRVRRRHQPLRRDRPGLAGHRHPQVRVPLPRRPGRARGPRRPTSTRRAARSRHLDAPRRRRCSCCRAPTTGWSPRRRPRRWSARWPPGAWPTPTCSSRARATASARRPPSCGPCRPSWPSTAQVLGFTPADDLPPAAPVAGRAHPSAVPHSTRGHGWGDPHRSARLAPMARVLVTEKIADGGLDALRAAGHDVDVRTGLDPEQLLEVVPGAHALIIRSSTQVTAEVLEAGTDLVVVGRAGIGLDNVDVETATRRGVMVVNAPQSNILSTAEHTMAMLLSVARSVPQAHGALVDGRWERSKWVGVELADKTLGIIGLGRIGKLVAQRASAFGMKIVAHDPFVAPERARQLNIELLDLADPRRHRRLRHPARGQDARDGRHDRQGLLRPGQAGHPHRERVARRGHRRGGAGRRARGRPLRGRRPRRVRLRADHRVAPVRPARLRRHPPPRRQHPRGPGQGRRHHRRAGPPGARRRVRAVRGEHRRGRGLRDRASLPRRRRAARAGSSPGSARGCRRSSRSSARASWPASTPASSPCRCSRARSPAAPRSPSATSTPPRSRPSGASRSATPRRSPRGTG